MDYPYKYCLTVFTDENYSSGFQTFYYLDYNDANADYVFYSELDSNKCILYRILKFDNFNL